MVLLGASGRVPVVDRPQLASRVVVVGVVVALVSSLAEVDRVEDEGHHGKIIKTQGHFNQCP
mgnify:CR=1 FL=1